MIFFFFLNNHLISVWLLSTIKHANAQKKLQVMEEKGVMFVHIRLKYNTAKNDG